mmetsp:Transcript_27646/g.57932  ORF Transcript_27646/g.57932 Transcript_27646/m.57932 type:complete len:90 (-) Transcript_27646:142-411(-)
MEARPDVAAFALPSGTEEKACACPVLDSDNDNGNDTEMDAIPTAFAIRPAAVAAEKGLVLPVLWKTGTNIARLWLLLYNSSKVRVLVSY